MNLDSRLLRELSLVRRSLALAVGLGLIAGALLAVQAYALAQIVSRTFLDGATLHDLRGWLAGLLAVAALRSAALWGSDVAAHHVAGRVKADLRERLFAHLLALGPAYACAERSGELAATATEGIDALDAYLSQYIPQIAFSALIPLAMLALIVPIDPLSGAVLLLTAPAIPLLMALIGHLANRESQKQWAQLSRLSAHFLDTLQGLTTLKLFGRSREHLHAIARISDEFRDATMRVLRIAFISALALEMLATISTALVAVQVGLRLLHGHIAFDEAFFVLILAPEYYLPLRALGARFHAGAAGVAAAQRIFEVLSIPAPAQRARRLGIEGDLAITFDAVSYAYDSGDRPALNGVTFAIAPRQTVALVGRSGSGKSTLASLLLRFIDPAAGRVLVNDHDLRDLDPEAWRQRIAWVPQTPHLFAETVADNIRLARPDAPLDAVIRAAEQARADAFIRDLPQGYDTPIGERGARLSGGQAQRIALARAFLKDAPFLILDEATSNLDPETEAELFAAMRDLMRDRAALIIAHRLATVRNADQIVVLERGQVAEIGTHDALRATGGVYAALLAGG